MSFGQDCILEIRKWTGGQESVDHSRSMPREPRNTAGHGSRRPKQGNGPTKVLVDRLRKRAHVLLRAEIGA